jgi:hypothetical protein
MIKVYVLEVFQSNQEQEHIGYFTESVNVEEIAQTICKERQSFSLSNSPFHKIIRPINVFETAAEYCLKKANDTLRRNALAKLTEEEKRVLGLME